MMNFERNIEKIREISSYGHDLAMEDGELTPCGDITYCEDCDFYDGRLSCSAKALEWLLEDDGNPSMERIKENVEAWELAGKIIACECDGGYSGDMIKEVFGTVNYTEVFGKNTYAEAAEKVKEWEDSKKFNIGDVVERAGCCGVILEFIKDIHCFELIKEACCTVITQDGYRLPWKLSECTKTGRSLPVQDWLRQIGGEEE